MYHIIIKESYKYRATASKLFFLDTVVHIALSDSEFQVWLTPIFNSDSEFNFQKAKQF